MGIINISAIKPGMVLAGDVKDRNGRMLVKAGTRLTPESLRILKIWGVTEADIRGLSRESVEEQDLKKIDPKVLAAATRYTEFRFQHNDPDFEPVAELMRLGVLHTVRRMRERHLAPEGLLAMLPGIGSLPPVQDYPELQPDALIKEEVRLGSLPEIFHKLVEVVNDPRSTTSDVAEVIGKDPDLSARLLRIVNSPFYGLMAQIDTISRAVAIIGSSQLISLAMGVSVVSAFKGVPQDLIDMDRFWRHSLSCGIAARILASNNRIPNTERFFVAGLLHDVGRLVLYEREPDISRDLLAEAGQRSLLLIDVERQRLGFTHDQLSGMLLERWKLPVSLENNVRWHHDPRGGPNVQESSLLMAADVITNALEFGSSGENLVPVLTPAAWEQLGIPVSALAQISAQMRFQVDEILQFFTASHE